MAEKKPSHSMQWFTTPHNTHHCHLNNETWVTVRDSGTNVKLMKWFRGCGLSPHETVHSTLADAQKQAEAWLAAQ